MKRGFPGDPEFTLDNFWKLPYVYVLEAVGELNQLVKEELHNYERPIGYLAFQNAEMNRDSKKRRKPFEPNDFYYYADQNLLNMPEPRYGAAAMELIRQGLFPSWALFTYAELKKRADDAIAPEFLCLQCDDAIILAPNIDGAVVSGMLIADQSASEQERTMVSPCGRTVTILMPKVLGKFEAIEESELRILRQAG